MPGSKKGVKQAQLDSDGTALRGAHPEGWLENFPAYAKLQQKTLSSGPQDRPPGTTAQKCAPWVGLCAGGCARALPGPKRPTWHQKKMPFRPSRTKSGGTFGVFSTQLEGQKFIFCPGGLPRCTHFLGPLCRGPRPAGPPARAGPGCGSPVAAFSVAAPPVLPGRIVLSPGRSPGPGPGPGA